MEAGFNGKVCRGEAYSRRVHSQTKFQLGSCSYKYNQTYSQKKWCTKARQYGFAQEEENYSTWERATQGGDRRQMHAFHHRAGGLRRQCCTVSIYVHCTMSRFQERVLLATFPDTKPRSLFFVLKMGKENRNFPTPDCILASCPRMHTNNVLQRTPSPAFEPT